MVINKQILPHRKLFFITWPFTCCVNPSHLYYIMESSLAVSLFGLTRFSALWEVKSLEGKSSETRRNWCREIEWSMFVDFI